MSEVWVGMARLTNVKRKAYAKSYYKKNRPRILLGKKENSTATADSRKDCEKARYKASLLRTKKKRYLQTKATERERYASHSGEKKAVERERYASHSDERKVTKRERYAPHSDEKKAVERERYASHSYERKATKRERYASHSDEKTAERERYASHSDKRKATKREREGCLSLG